MAKFGPLPPRTLPKRGDPWQKIADPLRTPTLSIWAPPCREIPQPIACPPKLGGNPCPKFDHRGCYQASTLYKPVSRRKMDDLMVRTPPILWGRGHNMHPPTHSYGHRGGLALNLSRRGNMAAAPPTHWGGYRRYTNQGQLPPRKNMENRNPVLHPP